MQAVDPVSLLVLNPSPHEKQASVCAVGAYVPDGHRKHLTAVRFAYSPGSHEPQESPSADVSCPSAHSTQSLRLSWYEASFAYGLYFPVGHTVHSVVPFAAA
jgi:hypothetical protein